MIQNRHISIHSILFFALVMLLSSMVEASTTRIEAIIGLDDPHIRVTGYGLDNQPTGSSGQYNMHSLTQQTDSGLVTNREISSSPVYDLITYNVDTRAGNSGSPLYLLRCIWQSALIYAKAIPPIPAMNFSTGFKNSSLFSALQSYWEDTLIYVDQHYFATVSVGNGSLFSSYKKLEDGIDNLPFSFTSTHGIVARKYMKKGKIFSSSRKIIFKALGKSVHIGGYKFT